MHLIFVLMLFITLSITGYGKRESEISGRMGTNVRADTVSICSFVYVNACNKSVCVLEEIKGMDYICYSSSAYALQIHAHTLTRGFCVSVET